MSKQKTNSPLAGCEGPEQVLFTDPNNCGVCNRRVCFVRLDRTPQTDSGKSVTVASAKMAYVPNLIEAVLMDAPSAESAIIT